MASSDSGHSSDDSSGSDDPNRSRAVPNSLLQNDHAYATGPDSAFNGTQQKKIDEEDGQSDDSEFHTPAQRSKRMRLPSLGPKKRREDFVAKSESDSFERNSLFDSPWWCRGVVLLIAWSVLCFVLNLILIIFSRRYESYLWVGMNLGFKSSMLMMLLSSEPESGFDF